MKEWLTKAHADRAQKKGSHWGAVMRRAYSAACYHLILRNRFEKEISTFAPDLRLDFQKQIDELKKDRGHLQGKLNQLTGKFAEYQLLTEFRSKKRFSLSAYFDGVVDERPLNIIDVRERFAACGFPIFQRGDGKRIEIDVHAKSSDGRVVLVEVRKTYHPAKSGKTKW